MRKMPKKFSKPMSLSEFNQTVIFRDTPTRVVYSHTEVGWYLDSKDRQQFGPHDIHKKQYLLPQYAMSSWDYLQLKMEGEVVVIAE